MLHPAERQPWRETCEQKEDDQYQPDQRHARHQPREIGQAEIGQIPQIGVIGKQDRAAAKQHQAP